MSKNYFLFNIKYKDKRFSIYTDEYQQKNFLRILDDNSLCYPELEDYINLNNIFNIKNLYTVYMVSKPVEFNPKVISHEENKTVKKNVAELDEVETLQSKITWSESPYGIKFIKRIEEGNCIYIFCENQQEIKEYLDVKNPLFNDVRMAISNNLNIPEKYKKFAFEYVNELEKNNPNQDLAILYYNMSNLKNIKSSGTSDNVIQGYFNKYEKEIGVAETENESIAFKHELTHATYSIEIDLGNVHVIKDIIHPTITDKNKILLIGMGANEGLTDNHRIEMGGKTLRSKNTLSYEQFQDEMQLCSTLLEIPTDELLNNNIRYFMDKMYEKGIYSINAIVSLMDATLNGITNNEIQIENSENIRITVYGLIFENLIKKWINEGKKSDEIYKSIFKLLDSGYIQSEIKKDSGFALNDLSKQIELRESIIDFVNVLLQRENMQTKNQEQLVKEFSNFEKELTLTQEIDNIIRDFCIYKDMDGNLKSGYAIMQLDGTFQLVNAETLEVDNSIKEWDYIKTLLETNKMQIHYDEGSILFDIKTENIELARKLADTSDNSNKVHTPNMYTCKDSNEEIKKCYCIITLEGEKIFYDFNMNRINPLIKIEKSIEETR